MDENEGDGKQRHPSKIASVLPRSKNPNRHLENKIIMDAPPPDGGPADQEDPDDDIFSLMEEACRETGHQFDWETGKRLLISRANTSEAEKTLSLFLEENKIDPDHYLRDDPTFITWVESLPFELAKKIMNLIHEWRVERTVAFRPKKVTTVPLKAPGRPKGEGEAKKFLREMDRILKGDRELLRACTAKLPLRTQQEIAVTYFSLADEYFRGRVGEKDEGRVATMLRKVLSEALENSGVDRLRVDDACQKVFVNGRNRGISFETLGTYLGQIQRSGKK